MEAGLFFRYTGAMSDLYLNFKDKPRVIDFLVEYLDYAPAKDKAAAEKIIQDYHDGKKLAVEKLADAVRKFATAAWPARFAINRYFAEEGKEVEWERILAAVRPSTAHLLKRSRNGRKDHSLDKVLGQAESEIAFQEAERYEIAEVRKQLRHDYWRDKYKTLGVFVKDGELELQGYIERLDKLRELAVDMPADQQREIFSKIERFEDRILFEGEVVPLQILDEEILYYAEQKELAPDEDLGGTV